MSETCRNCGATLTGPFCSACGQSDHDNHDTTLAHLVHELTHELLHVDGKIGRTVAALFTRPGVLTAEYWAGRRTAWIRPFRVFLIAAAAHFVIVHGIGPMNFDVLLQRTAAGGLDVSVGSAAERRSGATGLAAVPEEEQEAFLEKMRRTYAAVRYLAVPAFAVCTLLVYRRRQPFFANHVVLAAHFYAFWYSASAMVSLVGRGQLAGWIAVAISATYLVLALRRLFPERAVVTVLKAGVIYAVMVTVEMALAMAAALWVLRSAR